MKYSKQAAIVCQMDKIEEFITHSEKETAKIAADLAAQLSSGAVICLYGTLGAGKSVFARECIRKLCNNKHLEVPSPTFTLVQTYDSDSASISHYDLYRIEDPEEIYELDWEESLDGITIIEWPERLGQLKPAKTLDITITVHDNNADTRKIQIRRA